MKLRTAAFFVIAWIHAAGAADLDWARWSAERRRAAFHDLPGEISSAGISADKRDSFFSEYVRLDRRDHTDGLGIGLAIVKRSADMLGHGLTLWSEPGPGSRFTVRLPCSEAAQPRSEPAAAGQGAGRTLVVIEDDEQMRGAMADLLRSHGYVGHAAVDGDTLRRSLWEAGLAVPDALVSNVHLGLEDSLRLVARLR